jgi:hypothetical protein
MKQIFSILVAAILLIGCGCDTDTDTRTTVETLASVVKGKRICYQTTVTEEEVFVQFNVDGSYQFGSFLDGKAYAHNVAESHGKYETDGLIITISRSDGASGTLTFPSLELAVGAVFAVEDRVNRTITISKIEEASELAEITGDPPGFAPDPATHPQEGEPNPGRAEAGEEVVSPGDLK